MTLNFRGLGTRYCPVLLWFALLLLGGLALHSAVPVSQLSASGRNPSVLEAFAAPNPGSNHPRVRVDLDSFPCALSRIRVKPTRG